MIDSEQVAPADGLGARRKLIDRHAADTGGGQHGPNAGSRIQRRLNAALVESLHDSDVREALHAAAAEDERNTSRTRYRCLASIHEQKSSADERADRSH